MGHKNIPFWFTVKLLSKLISFLPDLATERRFVYRLNVSDRKMTNLMLICGNENNVFENVYNSTRNLKNVVRGRRID